MLKSFPKYLGLFIFLENAPIKNKRWVFEKWGDFETSDFYADDFCKEFSQEIKKTSIKAQRFKKYNQLDSYLKEVRAHGRWCQEKKQKANFLKVLFCACFVFVFLWILDCFCNKSI